MARNITPPPIAIAANGTILAQDTRNSITDIIGGTPLLELHRYRALHDLPARIVGKLEVFNPAGSIKDRTALALIREGERSGRLRPGGLVYDLTSGNTGIGLAAVAAARGYRTKFYTRDCISRDKIALLRHFGAQIVQIPSRVFVEPGARDRIIAHMQAANPDGFFANQIGSPANPRIHFDTTGPEIWNDTGGAIDILVGAVGTGGTASGAGAYLKSRNPAVRVVVVEPALTSLPSELDPYVDQIEGVHRVSDIPPDQLPGTYDTGIADEVIELDTEDARAVVRDMSRTEGLFIGLSAGSAIWAAARLARRPENAGKLIVAILSDSGERYLDAPISGIHAAPHPEILPLLHPALAAQ